MYLIYAMLLIIGSGIVGMLLDAGGELEFRGYYWALGLIPGILAGVFIWKHTLEMQK